MNEEVGRRIAENSCILEIHVRQPGFRKKIDASRFLYVNGNAGNISSDFLHVHKDILDVRAIKYLSDHRATFVQTLKSYSVPNVGITLGNGQYLMPLSKVDEIVGLISKFRLEREALINDFERSYTALIADARDKLGKFFNSSDYPPFSVIRKKYAIDYKFLSNTVPAELKRVSEEMHRMESSRLHQTLAKEAAELKILMRQAFVDLVSELMEKLDRSGATGKFGVVPEARIKRLQEFISMFHDKNFVGDTALANLVEKAREAFEGASLRELMTNEQTREKVVEKFDKIKEDTVAMSRQVRRAIDTTSLK